MPLPANLITVAELAAATHRLPPGLVKAIIQVESGGNTYAMRYEPAFLSRYVPGTPQRFGCASLETERQARATSWGLMQIMGQVARELGCKEPFLSTLCDAETGLRYGCLLLARLRDLYLRGYGWDGVISAYNQGSPIKNKKSGAFLNQGYVAKVRKHFP